MQVLAQRVLTFLRSFYACSQKYKKVWHFLRKTLDICLRFGYNNTRRQGHGPRRKEYADVAELADALDSGSSSLKRVWVQIPSSAPKSSNVCSGIFCFSDLFGMTSIVPCTVGADSISARGTFPLLQTSRVDDKHCPLRCCRRDALCNREMYAAQIHLSRAQKHFLQFFSRVTPTRIDCFCWYYSCTSLAICTGCAIMWIVTRAACAGGCKRRAHPAERARLL